jgi:hypothetical protein
MRETLLAAAAIVTSCGEARAGEPHEIRLKHPICEETYIVAINSRLAFEENNKLVYADPKRSRKRRKLCQRQIWRLL